MRALARRGTGVSVIALLSMLLFVLAGTSVFMWGQRHALEKAPRVERLK